MKLTKYSTMTEALQKLEKKGFKHGFKLKNGALECIETGKTYKPSDLRIVEHYRFEGNSDPDDMSIIFVVKSNDGEKGTIISSYGTYADLPLMLLLDKVKIVEQKGARIAA